MLHRLRLLRLSSRTGVLARSPGTDAGLAPGFLVHSTLSVYLTLLLTCNKKLDFGGVLRKHGKLRYKPLPRCLFGQSPALARYFFTQVDV